MSEPLPTDSVSAGAPSGDIDRAARIEQLLLSGLDFYFGGRYEDAINVWTRVIFLERGHSRARAYIERARSAMAERQRESEELLEHGRAAYDEGDIDRARDLLTRAIEHGASTADDALVFLQRVNQIDQRQRAAGPTRPDVTGAAAAAARDPHVGRRHGAMFGGVIAAGVVGVIALGAASLVSWIGDIPGMVPVPVTASQVDPLPIPRRGELVLARARDLMSGGHLRDALRTLERIPLSDPLHDAADRLRADIQRELLATAPVPIDTPEATARQ